MKIYSKGIINGIIEDKYGKRGKDFKEGDMPTYSLPIKIEDSPEGTVSYALVLLDHDSIPVCGFSWIHWTVANLKRKELMENESVSAADFIQGANSWYGALGGMKVEDSSCYGGMTPPDAPHTYDIYVYALDTMVDLKNGFFLNELYKAMEGHVLEEVKIKGIYNN